MTSNSKSLGTPQIGLLAPVILMVLAATAIPVELRPPGHFTLTFRLQDTLDAAENVLGYVPVGIVLGWLGPLRAVLLAAGLSIFAEIFQLFMLHRDPSVVDVTANVIGATLGTFVSSRWGIPASTLRTNRYVTLIAAAMAVALVLDVWAESGDAPSTRGSTSPGGVEAYWKLDETTGGVALDSSGHGLNGSFHNQPKRVAGVRGGAVQLDGKAAYIDFGHATAFRLKGSMTLSAWIHPSSFPVDDAAIVSTLIGGELGYQLDTTVDRGPRTIGFKLADACGNLMARYGKTVLAAGSWYHVAGVYDAEARTLDVYLNGRRDDGFLAGSVASSQRSARGHLYVGRRSDSDGYEFDGSIDDVHIYSFAMTQEEIAMDMHGTAPTAFEERAFHRASAAGNSVARAGGRSGVCVASSEPEDARIAGAAAAFGVLVAVASVGLWPSAGPFLWAFIAFATGMVLFPAVVSFTMPAVSRWMLPFLSLAGGLSVAASVRR